jgi:purine-cytosine permease-like protein
MTDELFAQIWIAARHNVFFWITHALGALCVLGAVLAGYRSLRSYKKAAMVLCFLLAIMTVAGIAEKWRIRESAAQTARQKQAVADRDGANLAFSPFIGLVVGSSYYLGSLFVFTLAGRLGHTVRERKSRRNSDP